MIHFRLKTAAAIWLLVCAGIAVCAVGESKLTIERPTASQYENPYAKSGQAARATPAASPYPSTSSRLSITTPTPGMSLQLSQPKSVVRSVVVPTPIATTPQPQPSVASQPVMPPVEDTTEPLPELPMTEQSTPWQATLPEPVVEAASEPFVEFAPPVEAVPELPPAAVAKVPTTDSTDSTEQVVPNVEAPVLPEFPQAAAPPAEPIAPPTEPAQSQAEIDAAMESFWSEEPPAETQQPEQVQAQPADMTPLPDFTSDMPYTPTVAELSQQLLPSVRRAYALAQRGALFASQAEFVEILQRIAQAKDAEEGGEEHSAALAAGLRALDEADDFMPGGVQLEAEMNLAVIASSHRTPVAQNAAPKSPRESIALYHRYAQEQLGKSVAGDRAGSMALYGLGKIYNRLANETDGDLRHQRKALAMFRASLVAGPENNLATNEVGVLLAKSGHPAEAGVMFRHAIDLAPSSTAYHNLAMVERKQGMLDQANANAQYADQLAARDRAAGTASRSKGIMWVAPQDLAQTGVAPQLPPAPPTNPMAANQPSARPPTTHAMPRGPSGGARPAGTGEAHTVAEWPQKLLPGAFRR